ELELENGFASQHYLTHLELTFKLYGGFSEFFRLPLCLVYYGQERALDLNQKKFKNSAALSKFATHGRSQDRTFDTNARPSTSNLSYSITVTKHSVPRSRRKNLPRSADTSRASRFFP